MRDPISPMHNDSSDYKYGKTETAELKWWAVDNLSLIAGRFDASALHIAHALKQTEVQKSYNKAREKPIDEYLVSFFSFLINHFLSWEVSKISLSR